MLGHICWFLSEQAKVLYVAYEVSSYEVTPYEVSPYEVSTYEVSPDDQSQMLTLCMLRLFKS